MPPVIPRSYGDNLVLSGYRDLMMSFESGEQATHRFYFNQKALITQLRAIVTKALAGTDAGTITPKNSAGSAMAGGTLTLAASSAIGTAAAATPTTNMVVQAGDYIDVVTAKSTAGGKAHVCIEWQPA